MTGLFFVSYLLGEHDSAIRLQLNLSVDTTTQSLRGHCLRQEQGQASQHMVPVSGSYDMVGAPGSGHPSLHPLIVARLQADLPAPVALQTGFSLHMLLSPEWKNGNASFRLGNDCVQDAPVTLEPTLQLKQAAMHQLKEYLRCTYGRAFGAYLPASFELSFVE
ncbi:DUF1842 domain-containing protein [Undibacterium sp.]|uniref:DUF1842 domain-containing protein n=1 Tax=Undibacterium sp. TaxID=1914977 RepID=UPI00374CE553